MSLAEQLVRLCIERGITIGTAESLTAGLVAAEIATVPGCSAIFRGGIVAYHPAVKHDVLGVPEDQLEHVVSSDVAEAMAGGAQRALGVALGLATTGVAGPDPLDGQPPGTVWIAAALQGFPVRTRRLALTGDRDHIRAAACQAALALGLAALAPE